MLSYRSLRTFRRYIIPHQRNLAAIMPDAMSLEYTSERAEELRENIKSVLAEMEEAHQGPGPLVRFLDWWMLTLSLVWYPFQS
jgi:hypothetical protein